VTKGSNILYLSGHARALLGAERVALNYMQRLSGIATLTARYVAAVKGTKAKILDTRKTTPGWRLLEKYAVRAGGGTNHRLNLSAAVLIKDNHLAAVDGDDALAVRRARDLAPRGTKIEISFHQEGNRATVLVVNGGTALPPERYRRLWDIYATGPDPEVMVSGSGIGLSLCKELIESMGGRVWAGPAHEGGSVFAVTLPSPWDLTLLDSLDTAISSRPTPWPTLWPKAYAEVGAAS
jgi:hypothetical protein